MIIIITTAITYTSFSMDQITKAALTVETKQTIDFQKTTEKFDVVTIGKVNNQFNMTVTNRGDIPVHLTRLWVENTTDSSWPVSKYDLDIAIPSGGSAKNIGQNIGLTALDTQSYVMKLVTERGNTQKIFVNSVGTESIYLSLHASPIEVPAAFSTTLTLEVINTGTNKLINLQPYMDAPVKNCAGSCSYSLTSGPTPTQFGSLDPGDIAIFRWVYKLTGDASDTFTFTGSLQNGVAGNTNSETVVIGEILEAVLAGQSLSAIGFSGQDAALGGFVFHIEDHNVPDGADYQMKLNRPDQNPGTFVLFDGIGDRLQFFSANASVNNVHIPAGIWNASLRYNSERLPSGMASGADNLWDASGEGGITYHFNDISPPSGLHDSGTDPTCTALASSNGAGVFGNLASNYDVTGGVNGSGAYVFDGDGDYIKIDNGGKDKCTGIDRTFASTTLWFKGDERADKAVTQTIFANMDLETDMSNNVGGIYVEIGDGTTNNHGQVFFTVKDDDLLTVTCASDRPDGDPGPNYLDGEWHHVAASYYAKGKCKLWIDDDVKDDQTNGAMDNHLHNYDEQLYVGAKMENDPSPVIREDFFKGTIDDLMYWNDYVFTDADVTALHEYSFGDNAHYMNFFISNATGAGTTVEPILKTSLNYMLPWSDPFSGSNSVTDSAGGNYTTGMMPLVTLKIDTDNRLNFTMSYASGEPLNFLIDDALFSGTGDNQLSSYLQVPAPPAPEVLPTYQEFSRSLNTVDIFVYNAGSEGAWLTYQGTRVVFNGTNGNYAGLARSMDDGTGSITLSSDQDGPFIPSLAESDIDFWHPKNAPSVGNPQGPSERIPVGFYDVTIFLNGYDESGSIIVRSISMGSVEVTE